jgi:hypothetical protein
MLLLEPVEPTPLDADPVEPVLDPVEPVDGVLDPVDPVLEPALPVLDPVEPVLDPVLPVLPVVEPVPLDIEPVLPVPDEPIDPLPAPEMLALISMNDPGLVELPVVPVAPAVPVVPVVDAVLPLPGPDTRHPVATTVCPELLLPVLLPVCEPLGVCAAAPAPSATAIIVPKRNCRFITSSVLVEIRCLCPRHGYTASHCKCGPTR